MLRGSVTLVTLLLDLVLNPCPVASFQNKLLVLMKHKIFIICLIHLMIIQEFDVSIAF